MACNCQASQAALQPSALPSPSLCTQARTYASSVDTSGVSTLLDAAGHPAGKVGRGERPASLHLQAPLHSSLLFCWQLTCMSWGGMSTWSSCRQREEDEQRQQLLGSRRGGPSWQSQEQMEAASMQSVQNSKRSLEETFQTGASILSGMADQRERLKVPVAPAGLLQWQGSSAT